MSERGRPAGARPGRGAVAVMMVLVSTAGCTPVAGGGGEFRDPDAPWEVPTPADVARRTIDAGDVRRHVAFLASDDLRGRATPSPGLARAAAWVAQRFQLAGLEPAGDDGGYVQHWPVPGDTAHGQNVIGVFPGSDLARGGEYVVLVAHLDHLGVGEPEDGDSIYNGAYDNASGVAALAEIAEAFAALPERPVRPVAFMAVSGRESGVRGSTWYADHPTLELTGAVAVLNLEMVGGRASGRVFVLDDDGPAPGAVLARTAAAHSGLRLEVVRGAAGDAVPGTPTDHAPFAAAGVPAVTVTSGRNERVHRPADEARTVDADATARVARLVFLAAHALATGAADAVSRAP